jgi:hypothetical protein
MKFKMRKLQFSAKREAKERSKKRSTIDIPYFNPKG